MDAIKALLTQITTFWAGKDKRFKRNAIIIAGATLAVVIILSVVLNQVDYAPLYSGLDAADSAAVISALDAQKIDYKVSGDSILVPAAQADRLRLSLSTEVKNGFSLEILQQGQGLGLSESDKQMYRKAYNEANLMNAIKTLNGVKDAKVMLTIPNDSSLVISNNKQYATAGVILTLEDGFEIKPEEVNAVALFVQKAVPGLQMENISIMDSTMRNLDATGGEKDDGVDAEDQLKMQADVQAKLRQQVMNLLVPVFGLGRVSAVVNVVLNFDREVTDSVKFEPVVGNKDGIVRSIEKLREKIVNGSGTTGGEPGTTTNTTGTTTYPVVNAENGTYEKNAETINYEMNEIKKHLETAQGNIRSLSVAVVVDNTGLKEDFTDSVRDMVSKAVGVTDDFVSVNFMPMVGAQSADSGSTDVDSPAVVQQKNQQERFYIIVGAVVLVVLLVMVLLFAGRKPKAKPAPLPEPEETFIPGVQMGYEEEIPEDEGLAAISIVKDNSAKEQIGKLIEKNPELVANLLRTWLADEQE